MLYDGFGRRKVRRFGISREGGLWIYRLNGVEGLRVTVMLFFVAVCVVGWRVNSWA